MNKEYNLDGNRGCLVGNWQEERQLEAAVGTARCTWTTNEKNGRAIPDNSRYQNVCVFTLFLNMFFCRSHDRTVKGVVRLHPSEWDTTTRETFKEPGGGVCSELLVVLNHIIMIDRAPNLKYVPDAKVLFIPR